MKEHQRIQNIGSENYSGKKILWALARAGSTPAPSTMVKSLSVLENAPDQKGENRFDSCNDFKNTAP